VYGLLHPQRWGSYPVNAHGRKRPERLKPDQDFQRDYLLLNSQIKMTPFPVTGYLILPF
jgi:hypothetical protein